LRPLQFAPARTLGRDAPDLKVAHSDRRLITSADGSSPGRDYVVVVGRQGRRRGIGSFQASPSGAKSLYSKADTETFAAIHLLAQTEGLIADPVYEGKALRGLLALANDGRFASDSKILLMHLGGTPAVHVYASQFGPPEFSPFST